MSSGPQLILKSVRFERRNRKLSTKSNDYFSARGNIDRLREYIRKCEICEFKPAANSEITETEQRKALQARREEAEYNSARGDVGRLNAYVRSCEICTYKSAALDEIKGANVAHQVFGAIMDRDLHLLLQEHVAYFVMRRHVRICGSWV